MSLNHNKYKKIIVTGASGLIGSEVCQILHEDGYVVYPLTSRELDLFKISEIKEKIFALKADYLVHLAWKTTGDYLFSEDNNKYFDGSAELFRCFYEAGGKRIISAGTCFEYDLTYNKKISEDNKLNPMNKYSEAKVKTFEYLNALYSNYENASFSWARIFYAYGKNEKKGRLVREVIDAMVNNKKYIIRFGQLQRDYIYSFDIALMISKILSTRYDGPINICTGSGVTIGKIATTFADYFDKRGLIEINEEETKQPLSIVGDNTLYKKIIGDVVYTKMQNAISEIIRNEEIKK